MIKKTKAYQYAMNVLENVTSAPMYVKKAAKEFLEIADDKNKKYMIHQQKLKKIYKITKLIIMPKGQKRGKTAFEALAGFQWLLLIAALCVVWRENPKKRRYETIILEIARKNGKTFLVGLIFLLLMMTEPKFAKLYSVAPDGAISKEIKTQIEEIIKSSPALCGSFNGRAKFKVLRDYIYCNLTDIKYTPLNTSRNRMDSREPSAYVADEVGALPVVYPLEAMASGQSNIDNPLGFIISTKYPTTNNPFEEQVDYLKRVLDGLTEDETIFGLLYEPDDKKNWTTNDMILQHANPLAIDVNKIMLDLFKKRKRAIEIPSARQNFLTKHCNIIYQGMETENYVSVSELQKCKVQQIDWTGKRLYVGMDLAISNDNCAVGWVSYDKQTDYIEAGVMIFFPEGKMEEKTQEEKVDYKQMVEDGLAIACGDMIVDYSVIENYVMQLEEKTGGKIVVVGFDRFNAMSTAQKLEASGLELIEITQHSSVLHAPTKLLYEKITEGKFRYEENKLLEINFENAKCTFDTNKNRYVNKKKSSGKIDAVFSIINAVYLMEQNEILGQMQNWGAIEI